MLVDGHHPVLARTAARWAKAHGRPVVVDAGSWKPVFRDVFGLADVVACSAQFTAPENALADVPVVVTTAGPDPVRWRGRNGSGEVAVPAVEARGHPRGRRRVARCFRVQGRDRRHRRGDRVRQRRGFRTGAARGTSKLDRPGQGDDGSDMTSFDELLTRDNGSWTVTSGRC